MKRFGVFFDEKRNPPAPLVEVKAYSYT